MTWIISFLIGNPLGRTIAKYAMIAALIGLAILMIYRKGRNDQALSRAAATVKALKERIEVDHEIRSMPLNARRDALKRWVR